MTVNEKTKAALSPLHLPMEPVTYTGPCKRYLTYNYDLIPAQYGDDGPLLYKALVQIHIVAPLGEPISPTVRRVMMALIRNGFTAPERIDAGDMERQHVVLECECLADQEDEEIDKNREQDEKGSCICRRLN